MQLSPSILVVDDEPQLRAVTAQALLGEGYAVRTAEHGGQALGVLTSWPVDALVLDLTMPVLDGSGFIENCRVLGIAVPIVAVSATMTPTVMDRLSDLGVTLCLAKPYGLDELLASVAQALESAMPSRATAIVVRGEGPR